MKIIKRIFCIVFAFCLVLPLAACGGGAGLDVPAGMDMSEDYELTWEETEGARSYEIEITDAAVGEPVIETSRRTSYSLAGLAVGDYSVRVRAVGGKQNDVVSDWSPYFDFHRDYESGILYSLVNSGAEYRVAKVGSASGDVVIEDVYRGKPVTSIADAAFRSAGARLTGVTVGNNVREIGASAFYNCTGLQKVTMPDSVVSLGVSAFQNCSALRSVKLSKGITAIPDYAFAHCSALRTFAFEETVVSVGASAFTGCKALTEIILPDSVVSVGSHAFDEDDALAEVTFGENIQTVSDYAFYGCDALTDVSFPETLAEGVSLALGEYAFANCDSLTAAALPEGAIAIGEGCFSYSEQFREISIPETVSSVGPAAFSETALTAEQAGEDLLYADRWLVAVSDEYFLAATDLGLNELRADTVGIADYACIRSNGSGYIGCTKLNKIEFPASLRYIGKYAFYNSPQLQQLTATRGGLSAIGDYAFANCRALSIVRLGNGLREIGKYAFMECTNLNQPNDPYSLVPATVTRVGTYAFLNTGLWETATKQGSGAIYAGTWVVGYTGEIADLILRDGEIGGISDYAFYNCSTLTSVQGLSRVSEIGIGAFYGCAALLSVTLNDNVTEIGAYTFYGCSNLYRVTFSMSLASIGRYAFCNCVSLNTVDLSGTQVASLGERAFYGCLRLMYLNLGTRLRSIGTRAFYKCVMLRETVIPGTVKEISEEAFANCWSIQRLTLGDGIEKIGRSAFRSCQLFSIVIPDSVKEIGNSAFYAVSGCTYLKLGRGLERIGDYAFGGILARGSVTIPAGVKEIGKYAFTNCVDLSSVIFSGEVPVIGVHAFYLCPNLTIYVKEGVEKMEGGWNSYFRPVVYGCTLSDDGSFVSAVKTGDMQYATALGGLSAPVREGFDFLGWATEPGGEVRYSQAELAGVPAGQTLYAIYEFHTEEEVPEDTAPSSAEN